MSEQHSTDLSPSCPECGVPVRNAGSKCKRCCHKKHGFWYIPEYQPYRGMMERCYYPKHFKFARYGGRGITVCDRWRESFKNFLADMGPRPTAEHTLERIRNNGNYEPGNCRWATRFEQGQNTSRTLFYEHDGKKAVTLGLGRYYRDPSVLHTRPVAARLVFRESDQHAAASALSWSEEKASSQAGDGIEQLVRLDVRVDLRYGD